MDREGQILAMLHRYIVSDIFNVLFKREKGIKCHSKIFCCQALRNLLRRLRLTNQTGDCVVAADDQNLSFT